LGRIVTQDVKLLPFLINRVVQRDNSKYDPNAPPY